MFTMMKITMNTTCFALTNATALHTREPIVPCEASAKATATTALVLTNDESRMARRRIGVASSAHRCDNEVVAVSIRNCPLPNSDVSPTAAAVLLCLMALFVVHATRLSRKASMQNDRRRRRRRVFVRRSLLLPASDESIRSVLRQEATEMGYARMIEAVNATNEARRALVHTGNDEIRSVDYRDEIPEKVAVIQAIMRGAPKAYGEQAEELGAAGGCYVRAYSLTDEEREELRADVEAFMASAAAAAAAARPVVASAPEEPIPMEIEPAYPLPIEEPIPMEIEPVYPLPIEENDALVSYESCEKQMQSAAPSERYPLGLLLEEPIDISSGRKRKMTYNVGDNDAIVMAASAPTKRHRGNDWMYEFRSVVVQETPVAEEFGIVVAGDEDGAHVVEQPVVPVEEVAAAQAEEEPVVAEPRLLVVVQPPVPVQQPVPTLRRSKRIQEKELKERIEAEKRAEEERLRRAREQPRRSARLAALKRVCYKG